MVIGTEITKNIIKELTKDIDDYSDVLNGLTLIYRKINIGDRYCYDIMYEGDRRPLIFYRVDLTTPDINLNLNILNILKHGRVMTLYDRKGIFDYGIVKDIIKGHRSSKLGEILK